MKEVIFELKKFFEKYLLLYAHGVGANGFDENVCQVRFFRVVRIDVDVQGMPVVQ